MYERINEYWENYEKSIYNKKIYYFLSYLIIKCGSNNENIPKISNLA